MKRLALLLTLIAGCTRPSGTTPTQFAIDPATGIPTPLASSVDPHSVSSWQTCSDPCAGLDVAACKADTRCQAVYEGTQRSCHPVPQIVEIL